jgi:hypothetical protein
MNTKAPLDTKADLLKVLDDIANVRKGAESQLADMREGEGEYTYCEGYIAGLDAAASEIKARYLEVD